MIYTKENIPKSGTPGRKKIPQGYERDYPHPTPDNLNTLPYTWYIVSFQSWEDFNAMAPDVPKQEWHDRQQYLLDFDYQRLAQSLWNDIEAAIDKNGAKKIANNKTGENPTVVYGEGGPAADFQSHKTTVTKKGGVAVVDAQTTAQSSAQQSSEVGSIKASASESVQENSNAGASGGYRLSEGTSGNASSIGSNDSGGGGGSSSSNSYSSAGDGITQDSEGRFTGNLDTSRFNTKVPPQRNEQNFIEWSRYAGQKYGKYHINALELDENFKRLGIQTDPNDYFKVIVEDDGTTLEPKQLLCIFTPPESKDPKAKKKDYWEFVVYTLEDNSYRFIRVPQKSFDATSNEPAGRDADLDITEIFWSYSLGVCKTG